MPQLVTKFGEINQALQKRLNSQPEAESDKDERLCRLDSDPPVVAEELEPNESKKRGEHALTKKTRERALRVRSSSAQQLRAFTKSPPPRERSC